MQREDLAHRDYCLAVIHHPPMWQVGIYPTRLGIPWPQEMLKIVSRPDRQEAIAEARRRVDDLLRTAFGGRAMFGGIRRKAVNDTVNAVRPLLRTFNVFGSELPKGFWQDPYILGYLTSVVRGTTRLSSKGKIAGPELAQVIMDVFNELVGQGGDEISDLVIALGKGKNPDFGLGFTNGDKFMCVSYGLPGYEDDPDVLKAGRLAAAMSRDLTSAVGPLTPQAETAAMLHKMLFHDPVRSRLGSKEEL